MLQQQQKKQVIKSQIDGTFFVKHMSISKALFLFLFMIRFC